MIAPSYCEDDDRCKSGAEASRSLGADDVAAVCAIYPPASKAPALVEDPGGAPATSFGCDVSATASANTPQGGATMSLVGFVLAGFAIVRKRLLLSRSD
jgi:hypothetical protein